MAQSPSYFGHHKVTFTGVGLKQHILKSLGIGFKPLNPILDENKTKQNHLTTLDWG